MASRGHSLAVILFLLISVFILLASSQTGPQQQGIKGIEANSSDVIIKRKIRSLASDLVDTFRFIPNAFGALFSPSTAYTNTDIYNSLFRPDNAFVQVSQNFFNTAISTLGWMVIAALFPSSGNTGKEEYTRKISTAYDGEERPDPVRFDPAGFYWDSKFNTLDPFDHNAYLLSRKRKRRIRRHLPDSAPPVIQPVANPQPAVAAASQRTGILLSKFFKSIANLAELFDQIYHDEL